MIRIPVEQVRRNNSNLYACDDECRTLFRALRKERFQKVRLDDYYKYLLACGADGTNPYLEVDLRMDLEKFMCTLKEDNKEVFCLFMQGYTPKEMAECTVWSQSNIYYKLKMIFKLFKKFYHE